MNEEKKGHTVTTLAQLETYLSLSEEELAYSSLEGVLPLAIPSYFLSLLDKDDPKDPLRIQVVPTIREGENHHEEGLDPLAEEEHSVTERLIHRYPSRVAFLVTDVCAMYCRHCFRRRFTGTFQGPASKAQIEEAASYVKAHGEIKEILLTGGDMMTLSDSKIDELIASFRSARPDLVIRLCTRMPAANPMRITDSLVAIFKKYTTAPFYLMTQFNHPRELTEEAVAAVAKFVDAGIPAMNQSVLLRGVNDNVDVLEQLCNKLVFSRIKPYYLFQGDLVAGTSHFRVPLERGLALEKELRKRLSGLAMPVYAVDLPQGGGKVPLSGGYLQETNTCAEWTFTTIEGKTRTYPKD
ncbi:KamA family radical SAM protein [Sphaerochaeta sp. PS]|uniref:KamA family radical SAM protein n=1 Tax=Sphaerochaeta sp. PS TaxID=3076336 RepID=UPI0028A4C9B1|nr:KamA family radical SAM protein [Sphaerochaeta sp. PS]MDT4761906.1 KamA family radical SAM protein [Sphaerochaeta sp. PS]